MVQDAHTDGGTFELMATFKQEGDEWCLVSVEDVKMPGYEDKGGDGGKFGAEYQKAMKIGSMTSTQNY